MQGDGWRIVPHRATPLFVIFLLIDRLTQACETMEYIEHPSGSLVVQTAWAVLALMEAEYPHVEPIRKGIKLIMSRQRPNGEWLAESIEGVFNKSCMITYPNYKFIFPLKALGMFARKYPDEAVTPKMEDE